MKQTILALLVLCISMNDSLRAQENLSITAPGIIPAPLNMEENGGSGCYFFSIQNVNLPGYPNAGDTEIQIEMNNITPPNGLDDLSSDLSPSHYTWSYDAATNSYLGVQTLPIGFLYSEVITVCFDVTTDSQCPIENNGHTVTGIVINGEDGNTDDNVAASFTCTDNITALPIDLLAFVGKNHEGKTHLNWITASEINNSHFIIERSTNGAHFEEIGKVEGNGTTLDISHYTFVDDNPTAGENYYRLRQYDFDNTNELSNIVFVEFDSPRANIYPNPASNFLRFQNIEIGSSLEIYRMDGQRISEQTVENGTINVSQLEQGTYIFKVVSPTGALELVEKIIIT